MTAPTVLEHWRTTLAATPVGADLLTLLATRPPKTAAVNDADWAQAVLDSLTHRRRLLSHLIAAEHADLAEFTTHYPGYHDWVLAELAMALHISETAAGNRAYLAHRLVTDLPRTWDALHTGQIGDWHAHTIADALDRTTPDVQEKVETYALGVAADLTPADLRQRCRSRVLRLDADAVRRRHHEAVHDRSVTIRALNDGMAQLNWTADAPDIAAAYAAISELAHQAHTPDDPRSADNRRCDTLLDLCLTAAGTDPRTLTGRHPSQPATTDSGHADSSPVNSHGSTGGADPATSAGATAGRRTRRPPVVVNVTVPLNVLLGSDDPGWLTGLGPITADQARLLTTDATLHRIITDPRTGQVLDVGRTTYRPPAHLARHVIHRDHVCIAPGCRKPATTCDLDHREPFHPGQPTGGTTSADNLAPLCRHHHNAKDHGGHTITKHPDGGYTWTTPLGRRYTKALEELTPTPPTPTPTPPPTIEPDDTEPPF